MFPSIVMSLAQNCTQRQWGVRPRYKNLFAVEVYVGDTCYATACAESKKEAHRHGAQRAANKLLSEHEHQAHDDQQQKNEDKDEDEDQSDDSSGGSIYSRLDSLEDKMMAMLRTQSYICEYFKKKDDHERLNPLPTDEAALHLANAAYTSSRFAGHSSVP
jgi:hypothetical protein